MWREAEQRGLKAANGGGPWPFGSRRGGIRVAATGPCGSGGSSRSILLAETLMMKRETEVIIHI